MNAPTWHLSLLCGAILAAASATAAADAAPGKAAAEVEQIFRDYQAPGTPGCAVGVFERGKSVLTRGFGTADIAKGKALDGDTLFYAASVSKQFTALVVVKLVEEGKVRLEDDVRRWVPELPDYGTPITVAMLLYHTSGLRDFLALFSLAGLDNYETLDMPTVLPMILRQKTLNHAPGAQFSYTNSGYFLLAQIVERATGERFHEAVRKRVLAPLGMNDSYVRNGPHPSGANVAHGYVRKEQEYVVTDTYPSFGGSGGLMTSINDLQKFDYDFHRGHRVWTKKVRELMLKPATLANGEKARIFDGSDIYYAGGLQVGEVRGQSWVSHGGGAAAFRNEYVRLPDLQASVAVLCNRGDADPDRYVQQTLDAFHRADLRGEWPKTRPDRPDTPETAKLDAALVDALVGRYRSDDLDAEYVFTREGDALKTTLHSRYAKAEQATPIDGLAQLGDGDLRGSYYRVKLERGANGVVSGFTVGTDRVKGLSFRRVSSEH